mmetsp:Transcript_32269/g.126283  ORF Transcript_32269/g.126283 Transcript_32269/m.126283 type:complete len:115 (-) Transcript_32269:2361-2705(-)
MEWQTLRLDELVCAGFLDSRRNYGDPLGFVPEHNVLLGFFCPSQFVRTVAREQQMKGPGTVTESGKPVAVADAMPSQNTQITPRREIQLLINKTLVSSMARAAKHQALAMKDTW